MNQNQQVLERLRRGSLTRYQALEELGIMRLGARIYDLMRMGHNIQSERIEARNRDGRKCHVAKYTIVE